MNKFDFLREKETNVDDENLRLRNEAITTLKSYSHHWDILAELLQNSVDAIEQNTRISKGRIDITFDVYNNSIKVNDNGTGISIDEFKRIFKPHVTFKYGKNNLRGEKGVGLSFILFSTNHLEVTTSNGKQIIEGKIDNAFDWVAGKSDKIPILHYNVESESKNTFTEIILNEICSIQEDFNLFSYEFERLKYVLRTKTAVGNTAHLFGDSPKKKIDINLTFIDSENETYEEKIPYRFDYPQNYIKPNINFGERKDKKYEGNDRAVRGKAVFDSYIDKSASGKKIKVYYFVCSRYKYYDMSKKILGYEDKSLIQGGIFLSTKNMPTGIEILPPTIGKAGYWANLYILVEYDDLNLDMGRKFVPGRITKMVRDQVEKIYKELSRHFSDIVDTIEDTEEILENEATIDNIWDDLASINNINLDFLSYFKYPVAEQGVVAIFYELIGLKKIKGYSTWRLSSKDQYDAFAKYRNDKGKEFKILIEFKFHGEDVIKDIHDNVKDYHQIKLLVCWEIDKQTFISEGYDLMKLKKDDPRPFNGVTHKISIPQIRNEINVIELKSFLKIN